MKLSSHGICGLKETSAKFYDGKGLIATSTSRPSFHLPTPPEIEKVSIRTAAP